MFVDLQNVPTEGLAIERSMDSSLLPVDPREFRVVRNVEVTGRLVKTDDQTYRLRGRLSTAIELPCVRCLEPFDIEVREELDLLYLPQSRNVALEGEEDRGLDDEELAVSFYRDEKIDLTHAVWEQIVLSLPMKPVCKEVCEGLCPHCGVNRNESRCACAPDETDPRWQALKSLLEP